MTFSTVDPLHSVNSWLRPNTKRMMDVTLVVFGLAAIWPLLALITIAISTTSRGPVLFAQTRIGLNGRPFKMYKFRSMCQDAELVRDSLAAQSDRDGICLKLKNDPRVTTVGKFIRRWSMDELPQLLNVLKGDMSLVGPRPALPEEVRQYPSAAHDRHRVKPGITGLWQVSGRADLGFAAMIRLDLEYIRTCSIKTDVKILMRTVSAVLNGHGAY